MFGSWLKVYARARSVLLVPARGVAVQLHGALAVVHLDLEQLGGVLHVGSRPPEVALLLVPLDGRHDATDGILGVVFPVDLEGIDHLVGRIVGFVQLVPVNTRCCLKGLPRFLVCCVSA
jgi:hypothetical protein